MLPVLIAGIHKVSVSVDHEIHRMGDHLVTFGAPAGNVFTLCGRRFVVADSKDHEGDGLLVKNAVPYEHRRRRRRDVFPRANPRFKRPMVRVAEF